MEGGRARPAARGALRPRAFSDTARLDRSWPPSGLTALHGTPCRLVLDEDPARSRAPLVYAGAARSTSTTASSPALRLRVELGEVSAKTACGRCAVRGVSARTAAPSRCADPHTDRPRSDCASRTRSKYVASCSRREQGLAVSQRSSSSPWSAPRRWQQGPREHRDSRALEHSTTSTSSQRADPRLRHRPQPPLGREVLVPQMVGTHGVVASLEPDALRSVRGQGGLAGNGALLAYDLRRHRSYGSATTRRVIDSIAITPDGERSTCPTASRRQQRMEAGRCRRRKGEGLDHRRPEAAQHDHGPRRQVRVSRRLRLSLPRRRERGNEQGGTGIGPLNGPGVPPFTINGSQTLAFTTTGRFWVPGEQHQDRQGAVLRPSAGFTWDP